jgi:hypothetical protein
MINNAPSIFVSGAGKLKVYSVDLETQTVDSPGRFTVSYVDKDNNLPIPTLSYVTPTTIRVGSISLSGFPVSYKRNFSSEGESLLVVSYVDESFLLDKYFIGLNNKHWPCTNYSTLYRTAGKREVVGNFSAYSTNSAPIGTKPNFLILVGTPIDPCQSNFSKSSVADPCDPCPKPNNSNAESESNIDCDKLRSMTIFEVDYNFTDFLNAISSVFKVVSPGNPNPNYRTSYSGTLREVLQAWCSDFGFSFFVKNKEIVIEKKREKHLVVLFPFLII